MRSLLIGAWLLALVGCAGREKVPTPVPALTRVELWVDPGVPLSGDGSRERPLKSIEEGLQRATGPSVLHLATGMYKGPFQTPPGLRIEGRGATVLYADGSGEVLVPQGTLELSKLIVQGGQVGIRSGHRVELDDVELSGQRKSSVVITGATLQARKALFTGTVSESVGIQAAGGATVEVAHSRFTGAFRRAVVGEEGAVLRIEHTTFEGPATAIYATSADTELREVEISGGRGSGISAAGGNLKVEALRVHGHEYGLLAGEGTRVQGRDLSFTRPDRAGMGLVGARAELQGITIVETGSYGAIHQVSGELDLRAFVIRAADAYGINVIAGRLVARDGVILGVSDTGGGAGDGIHLRRTRAWVSGITIIGTAGSGVLAAEGSEVALRDLVLERSKWGGVLAETGARVEAASIVVRDAPSAIAVPGNAQVRLHAVTASETPQGLVWAECGQGAEVHVARSPIQEEATLDSPCIGRWDAPTLFDPFESITGDVPAAR